MSAGLRRWYYRAQSSGSGPDPADLGKRGDTGALISVYDKHGVVEFARELADLGWELVSTGGTLGALREAGLEVVSVSDVTNFPEILDGRVKTLHPMIHGGLLGRPDLESDDEQMREHGIEPFHMLVVNLYPFEATIAREGVPESEAIEQIDIGGPAMLRAAAKNHEYLTVVVDPADYEVVVERLRRNDIDHVFRRRQAAKVFAHTSAYDATVSGYLQRQEEEAVGFPGSLLLAGKKVADLRYGENPHQRAASYRSSSLGPSTGIMAARQLGGKELSFNNLLDADAAWNAVQGWDGPAVVIVKHTIPCGLAVAGDLSIAYERALEGDPVSAFGGIVAMNRPLDADTAEKIGTMFYEVIIAPGFDDDALDRLRRKKQLRLLEVDEIEIGSPALELKTVLGGWLLQEADQIVSDVESWRSMASREPTDEERRDLIFAWRAVRHVKSNAIVLAHHRSITGVGSGQPNRVESVSIAVKKAGTRAVGSVLASDAFFPFPDGVEVAAAAGVTAIVQPGGSIRDEEVIAAAERAGLAMLFTGERHFRH
jgi:phosphoribosylaminoimidazolecarboxamide formyltransferase / IMP cyclohydrolase